MIAPRSVAPLAVLLLALPNTSSFFQPGLAFLVPTVPAAVTSPPVLAGAAAAYVGTRVVKRVRSHQGPRTSSSDVAPPRQWHLGREGLLDPAAACDLVQESVQPHEEVWVCSTASRDVLELDGVRDFGDEFTTEMMA